MLTQPRPNVTPEEYLKLDRESEGRSEYFDGEIYPVLRLTLNHARITRNLTVGLSTQLQGRPCELTAASLKVQTRPRRSCFYPDIVVFCGKPRFVEGERDMLCDATLIIEVLSPSTGLYDRGLKFFEYRRLPSLQDYVVVEQDRVFVEHNQRQEDGSWVLREYSDPDAILQLPSIECSLRLSDIYERVEFETEATA